LWYACLNGQEDVVRFFYFGCENRCQQARRRSTKSFKIACSEKKCHYSIKILLASSKTIGTRAASTRTNSHTTPAQEAKKQGFNEIAELIDRYEENPEKIIIELRECCHFSADELKKASN